jgi:long-subunit acyl-CoA synthetase (AMP-forming)
VHAQAGFVIVAPEHWSAVRHAIASQQAHAIESIQAQPGTSALGHGALGPLCINVRELAQDAGEGADAHAKKHTSVLPRPSSHGWRWQECPSAADDLCWVYFTSGSSGLPKGVLCQHKCASFCTSVRLKAPLCARACACERACGSAPTWVPWQAC